MTEFQCNDSFMVMEYTCEKCGAVERIWNSRNNVCPFSVGCTCCSGIMTHTNWTKDRRVPDYKPPKGSRYFADWTHERAAELAKKRVESAKGTLYELHGEEADAMIEGLTVEFLNNCCSMDVLVA